MKNKYLTNILFLSITMLYACEMTPTASSIIAKSNEAHGTSVFEQSKVSFNFRNFGYSVERRNDEYIYTRSFQDSLGLVEDSLYNSADFVRSIDGLTILVSEEMAQKYSSSINSVLYFFQIPLPLNDPAVISNYLGRVKIKNTDYHMVEVKFSEDGGGQDFEDVYVYWINRKSNLIDFIAYSYLTEGGGVRFRQAINRRTIGELIVQDYINYSPLDKNTPLTQLSRYFEEEKLLELSRIINENVQVQPF